jgi:hypothetical protein
VKQKAKSGKIAEDTLALLRTGGSICVFGLICGGLTMMVFGGVGIHGPTTNAGWLALIVFIMSMPFGMMLLALGVAKWIRGKSHPDEMN